MTRRGKREKSLPTSILCSRSAHDRANRLLFESKEAELHCEEAKMLSVEKRQETVSPLLWKALPESSAVSASVSPYSNSRLGDSMELCRE